MQSLKFAHLVKEKTGAEVYKFYIDIRTPAKAYDEFYQRVIDEGVHFVRGKVAEVTDAARMPERRRQAHHPGGRHPDRQAAAHPGRHGRSSRPACKPRADAKEVAHQVRHLVQRRRLVHREAPQARPGRHDDRRRLRRRRLPGPEGHPCHAWRRARRPRPACCPSSARARSRSRPPQPSWMKITCVGCKECIASCPYQAIEFLEDKQQSARASKRCARAVAPAWAPACPSPSA